MTRHLSRPSLRAELLATFAILSVAALLAAVTTVVLLYERVEPELGVAYAGLIIAADVGVVIALFAFQINRLIARPLRDVAETAEAIAAGDLQRRVEPTGATEVDQLAQSVNRMTERLLEEQAHLVRAEKLASIGRLAAGIAREIGHPLRALDAHRRVLRDCAAHDPRARASLDALERETARIDRIVRGLRDYSRPAAPSPTPIDVNASLRHVVDLLCAQGVLRRMELRLELSNEMPHVHGERQDLEQLFVNLMINAAHAVGGVGTIAIKTTCATRADIEEGMVRAGDAPGASVPHPPSPRVRRWLESDHPPEAVVKVVVADSGDGVPEEDAERVFDPFVSTGEHGADSGLALAIVLRIADNFRGIVWVQPAREGGSAFHVLFPLVLSATEFRPGAHFSTEPEPTFV
ncbi:MAG TPA: HAMP domain-containing protein [Gemmatimonadaceae bacterium]|nr:HAMP domain-containing protein [Gemmatimonadaceae bacterium]